MTVVGNPPSSQKKKSVKLADGLSLWQLLPVNNEAWSSKRYFNEDSDAQKMLTADDASKLRFEIQMPFAVEAVNNLCRIMRKWCNSYWADWVLRSAEMFQMFYYSLEAKLRPSTITPGLMLDIIDEHNELCSSYLRELVGLAKTISNETSAIMLSKQYVEKCTPGPHAARRGRPVRH